MAYRSAELSEGRYPSTGFRNGTYPLLGNGLYGLISLYWCHATYSSDPVPPLR
jgi:hypothetical protein